MLLKWSSYCTSKIYFLSILRDLGYLQNKKTSLRNSVANSGEISRRHAYCRKCRQLSSTDGRRRHFETRQGVHLCVQDSWRDIARCMGFSAQTEAS